METLFLIVTVAGFSFFAVAMVWADVYTSDVRAKWEPASADPGGSRQGMKATMSAPRGQRQTAADSISRDICSGSDPASMPPQRPGDERRDQVTGQFELVWRGAHDLV